MIGVLMHYAVKNLSPEEITTIQIQIFFAEIIDQLNAAKSGVQKEIISEINDGINSFQISEKLEQQIKLQKPNVNEFLGPFRDAC